MALQVYEVTLADGRRARLKLSDEDARRIGVYRDITPRPKAAPRPANKAKTPANKAKAAEQ